MNTSQKYLLMGLGIIILIQLIFILLIFIPYNSKSVKCGKEGHFSHSSGGGIFSWNAVGLNNHKKMSNPYMFIMFETYIDGTSDHYIVDIIDLPNMKSNIVTVDGNPGVLQYDNLTISAPDKNSLKKIDKAQKKFFDMLPCYSGSYLGKGTQ